MSNRAFNWRDGERWIVFGEDTLDRAVELLGERGFDRYALLSTERALSEAPEELGESATAVHDVEAGGVPEAAAAVLDAGGPGDGDLVALGGGRVVDVAKAIAAVEGRRVAAIPTTLSGAEMTTIHRLPAGREGGLIRPVLVLADAAAMTGQPEPQLRASAMNALAHGAEALWGPLANPLASMAGLGGAEQIAATLDQPAGERDRAGLALGALLCGYAIDSALFALHHVISQTTVRVCRTPHAETNAAYLPQTMEAMRERAPEAITALAAAISVEPGRIGERIAELAGGQLRLGELGADRDCIEELLDGALARGELQATPDPPGRDQLRELVEAAW